MDVTSESGPLVVIGDVFLDIEIEGRADRCSPEAQVPVVDVTGRSYRPGGAGLAAAVTRADTEEMVLIGGFAADAAGHWLRESLAGITRVVELPFAGSTVCKQRVRACGPWAAPGGRETPTPITRLDTGDGRVGTQPLTPAVAAALRTAGAVLVADYGRGAAAHPELRALLAARAERVPLIWDPHPRGPEPIPGAALVVPNDGEAEALVPGLSGPGERARALTGRWDADAVAVTVGAEGAVLHRHGPTAARRVPVPPDQRSGPGADTCGAGDRFAGAAAAALAAGAGTEEAVVRAVAAASAFVAAGAAAAFTTSDIDSWAQPGDLGPILTSGTRPGRVSLAGPPAPRHHVTGTAPTSAVSHRRG
ncbi:PfkB family carbohydrate kinase [Nocardia sp. X0981]